MTHPLQCRFFLHLTCIYPLYISSTFLSSFSGPHRDLHSFPTRRSSDLSPSTSAAAASQRSRQFPIAAIPASAQRRRSEEHTSELQSRGHLVCRLLLEKKKKKC